MCGGGGGGDFVIPIQFLFNSKLIHSTIQCSSFPHRFFLSAVNLIFPFTCHSSSSPMNESRVLFERYRTVFHNIALNNGAYCLNDSASSDVLLLIHLVIDVGIAAISHC